MNTKSLLKKYSKIIQIKKNMLFAPRSLRKIIQCNLIQCTTCNNTYLKNKVVTYTHRTDNMVSVGNQEIVQCSNDEKKIPMQKLLLL